MAYKCNMGYAHEDFHPSMRSAGKKPEGNSVGGGFGGQKNLAKSAGPALEALATGSMPRAANARFNPGYRGAKTSPLLKGRP